MLHHRLFCSIRAHCLLIACLVLWPGSTTGLRADGIILPPVAAPEVTMPDQRALLIWRDGLETLVIESRFTGKGRDFAWIVPLPSKPEIKPATAGTLPTAAAVFRPRIKTPGTLFLFLFALFILHPLLIVLFTEPAKVRLMLHRTWAIILGCITIFFGWGSYEARSNIGVSLLLFALAVLTTLVTWELWQGKNGTASVLLGLFLVALLGAMLVPAFQKVRGGPSGPDAGGLTIERQLIGDYEVFTITGGDPKPINDWLGKNGFDLPPQARPVIEEHAKAGGCFVAARLHRAESTAAVQAPAPLAFTFRTTRPVYPMKLTGAGTHGPLDVELYVFGNAVAKVKALPLKACGRVVFADEAPPPAYRHIKSQEGQPDEDRIWLTHAALRELCAGAQIATRLGGRLRTGDMRQDLFVEWQPFDGPRGLVKFTATDAWGFAGLAALTTMLIAGGIGFWVCRPGRASLRIRIGILAGSLAIGTGVAMAIPTVPVVSGGYSEYLRLRELSYCLDLAMEEAPFGNVTEAEAARLFRIWMGKNLKERMPFFEELPNEGDTPGCFQLRKLPEGRWELVLIDGGGQERRHQTVPH